MIKKRIEQLQWDDNQGLYRCVAGHITHQVIPPLVGGVCSIADGYLGFICKYKQTSFF
jgi:hypothetical protein